MNSEIIHRLLQSFSLVAPSGAMASELEDLRKSASLLLSAADAFGRTMFALAAEKEEDPVRRKHMQEGEESIRRLMLDLGKDMSIPTDQVGKGEPGHPLTEQVASGRRGSKIKRESQSLPYKE